MSLFYTCDSATRTATATIRNSGNANAGEFLAYINADENPTSDNHIPQIRHTAAGLATVQFIVVQAAFGPLAHQDNNNLHNVFQITAIADPNEMVTESNEGHNRKSIACHF